MDRIWGLILSVFVLPAPLLAQTGTGTTKSGTTGTKAGTSQAVEIPRGRVLVVVNGENLYEGDYTRGVLIRAISEGEQPEVRTALLEQLVDQALARQFLAGKKIAATPAEIDEQLQRFQQLAKKVSPTNPEKYLQDRGLTDAVLKAELALPLAWQRYVQQVYTPARLREYFEQHQAEFDGTKLRGRQIFLKVDTQRDSDELQTAERRLAELRTQLLAQSAPAQREQAFIAAARQMSEAPSKDQGGDVGWFAYRGKLPQALAQRAFALQPGEITPPVRTPYGVHLLLVTERQRGELSLEDVRRDVLARASQELQRQTVSELRKTAKIEWKVPRDEVRELKQRTGE